MSISHVKCKPQQRILTSITSSLVTSPSTLIVNSHDPRPSYNISHITRDDILILFSVVSMPCVFLFYVSLSIKFMCWKCMELVVRIAVSG